MPKTCFKKNNLRLSFATLASRRELGRVNFSKDFLGLLLGTVTATIPEDFAKVISAQSPRF